MSITGSGTQKDELLAACEPVAVFRFDDLLVKGNRHTVVSAYRVANPDSEFRVWLIDQGLVIKEL